MHRLPPWLFVSSALVAAAALAGERVYLAPEAFLARALGPNAEARALRLTPAMEADLAAILGHAPREVRQRYWVAGEKSAWILEEIGKEAPITAGFVVANGRIAQARVLIYRESRGGEIRYPAFLEQYAGAGLGGDDRLDRNIDGIAGATLSVRAMEKMAREALYLDRAAREVNAGR